MTLLHVVTSARAEGTPMLVLDMMTCERVNQEVLFVKEEGELLSEFQNRGRVRGGIVPEGFTKSGLGKYWHIIKNTKHLVSVCNPEVLCCWNTGISPYVILGARLAGVKKLLIHAGNPAGKTFFGGYLMSWWAYWMAWVCGAKVVCCSEYIKNSYVSLPFIPEKIFHTVFNAVDLKKFEAPHWENKKCQVVMVATLERHKDHPTLLKAWKIVNDLVPAAQLRLAGDGSLRASLEKMAEELGLINYAFLGSVKNVPQLLAESKCFVLSTTEREGFGTVLIEAMASNCAVVATNVAACREVLQEGKHGKLVTVNNEKELADQILTVLKQTNGPAWIREAADYAKNFSIDNMLDSYIRLTK